MEDKLHPLWEYFLWDKDIDKVVYEIPNLDMIGMTDLAKKLAIRQRLIVQKRILEQRTHYKLLKRIIKEVDILVTRQTLRLKKTLKGYEEKRFWKVNNEGNVDIILRVGAKEVFFNGMSGIRFVLPNDWVEVLRFLVDLRDLLKLGEVDEEFWEYDKIQLIKDAKKAFRLGYEQMKSREYEKEWKSNQKSLQDFWDKQNAEWNAKMKTYREQQEQRIKEHNSNKATLNTKFEDLFDD